MPRFLFTIAARPTAPRAPGRSQCAPERSGLRRSCRGDRGTVKAMKPEDVAASGADIILGNTYHLMLRPGRARGEARRAARFIGWDGPI